MSDDHPDHELDPEREADVRRLLAEARYDEPVPDDVAARLDRVLAELVAEGPPEQTADRGRVVDLAAQRRRRRVRNLLVAAAAVAVVGVGLSRVDLPTVSEIDADGAGSSAEPATALQDGSAADSELDAAGGDSEQLRRLAPEATSPQPLVVDDDDFASEARLQALRTSSLAYDAGGSLADAPSGRASDRSDFTTASGAASWFTCQPGPFGAGRLVAVEYDGNPAVLAIRPSTGDSTVVELLRCGTGDVLRSATVPVP